jgi:signal peptidase II
MITVAFVIIADQITKFLAVANLSRLLPNGDHVPDHVATVIDGFFRFKYAENTGAAWSLFKDASAGFRIPFFIIITLVAIGFIVWFYRKIDAKQKLLALAISSILGGALGNLIDRIRMGYVVDFIDWYITVDSGEKHWPTFNVADAAITVGVVLLMIEMIFRQKKSKQEEPAPKSAK